MTVEAIKNLKPSSQYFVGVDSDGCIFDSMEIKHRECFCPAFIDHFELQPVARYAREAWEFVNLYSRTRGLNRFHCIILALDLLSRHEQVRKRGFTPMKLPGLEAWVQRETRLSNPALEIVAVKTEDPDLIRALKWSRDVNSAVKKIVHGVKPFFAARQSLEILRSKADVMVVSQTPVESLYKEWAEHGVDHYILVMAGQEIGTKAEQILLATRGRYKSEHILMIGDSLGDLAAAQDSGAFFYPIIPGQEDDSWIRFRDEGIKRFFSGCYTKSYEASLAADFDAALPAHASWEVRI